jgi:hypothetical protein
MAPEPIQHERQYDAQTTTSQLVPNGTAGGKPGKIRTLKNPQREDHRLEALSLIEEKLPRMTPLKAVLALDLGLDDGPVYKRGDS